MQFTFVFLSEINKFYYIILKSYFVLLITVSDVVCCCLVPLFHNVGFPQCLIFYRVEDSMFTCVWMPFLSVTASNECGV